MIRDREKYSGCVFARLIDQWGSAISFQLLPSSFAAFYLVGNDVPILVKYSKSRRSPWTFTFQPTHLTEYRRVADRFGECIVVFVCGSDGIAAVDFSQFTSILNVYSNGQESIIVRRRLKEMYGIKGSLSKLDGKIARSSLIDTIGRHLGGN